MTGAEEERKERVEVASAVDDEGGEAGHSLLACVLASLPLTQVMSNIIVCALIFSPIRYSQLHLAFLALQTRQSCSLYPAEG